MAMRRSRIQIKPNTGPRAVGKAAPSENSSSSQTLQTNTPLSPIKNTLQSPVKTTQPHTPVELSSSSPIKPSTYSSTPTEAPVITKLSSAVSNANLNKTIEIQDDEEIQLVSSDNSIDMNVSAQKERSENKESKISEPIQTVNKTVSPPKQRTRLKKQAPKIPGNRQAPKPIEKDSATKEAENTNLDETDCSIVLPDTSEEDTSTVISIGDGGDTTGAPIFKKPETPKKKSQPVRECPPLFDTVPTSTTLEQPAAKTSTSGRPRTKTFEGVRRVHKCRTQFKQTEPPDRSKMTIMDLIHWNPIQNPMKRCNESTKTNSTESLDLEPANEQSETIPETTVEKEKEPENFIPGPRVIIGENGEITLDESSLVIEQTAPENNLSQEVVYETSDTTYATYSKKVITKQFWTMKETAMFYKALSVVGTDFALMSKFFPKRTRADLKRKFKKEERTRRDLLDKAVSEWHNFDLEDIQDFLFCKELEPVNDQDREEAMVDNPDAVDRTSQSNNYVRKNLLNVGPKKRGRPPGKKKVNEKGNVTQKENKNKKGPILRNAWSDEEAEPVDDEDMTDFYDDVNSVEDEQHECQIHGNDDSCDCCQLKTKTSKRQKSLEAKKRKLQELEQERAMYFQSTLGPVRNAPRSPSPELLHDSVPFTVVTNQSLARSGNKTPSRALLLPPSLCSSPSSTCSTPDSPVNIGSSIKSPTHATQNISSNQGRDTSKPINFVTVRNALTASPLLQALRSPHSTINTIPNSTANPNANIRSPPHFSVQSTSSGQVRDTSIPKPVNFVNINNSVASPLLQSLLNKASPGLSGTSPGQFLLVADKTPNNEQVLHVYLVSPNNQSTAQSPCETPATDSQVNTDVLQRLGIRPITHQQANEGPERKS